MYSRHRFSTDKRSEKSADVGICRILILANGGGDTL